MVTIRFQRRGTRKTAKFRIVATDRQRAQSSRVLEVLGHYDPLASPPLYAVDEARLSYWVSMGAQISEAVQKLLHNRTAKRLVKAG